MATSPGTRTAPVGYIGYGTVFGYGVRGVNFNVKAHQQIYHGDPVSNAVDQPVYHVGPLEVEGDVSWPLTMGTNYATLGIAKMAIKRVGAGGIGTRKTLGTGNITTFFPPATGYEAYSRTANNCMINRLSYKGNAGERIEANVNVIGLSITEKVGDSTQQPVDTDRIMTWDDVWIAFGSEVSGELKDSATSNSDGCVIKEFSIEINNNITRANTYCFPSTTKGTDITATALILGRRQVSGSLTFIGSSPTQKVAINNILKTNTGEYMLLSLGSTILFVNGITYELQQIDLTSGVVYGRVSFTAHGGPAGGGTETFNQDSISVS
jgi:hypothetical protein